MYYVYGSVRAIPIYRVYRLYDSIGSCLTQLQIAIGIAISQKLIILLLRHILNYSVQFYGSACRT